ncbi:hypothetical protein MSI_27300 [Treponema sp. JC4]|uniref:hypothetical protein n=1 Tax=Treponema sp. JC4 TaxID=1124982 RepID=UPI00025B0CEF|nr:hypothetical protein [Treponema sp. JC4]EID83901.1 hypothetical protein MSI_27300 [Treponema sp. JC4]
MAESLKDYLLSSQHVSKNLYINSLGAKSSVSNNFDIKDYNFFRIDEITYEDEEKFPKKEALENFIGTMNVPGINFIYLITGSKNGVRFYYGVSRNSDPESIGAYDVSNNILRPSLQGNFRGSKVSLLEDEEKKELHKKLCEFKRASILEGVPSVNKDDDKFQSVDRLVDVMIGDEFALMLILKSLSLEEIDKIRNSVYSFYNAINPYSKQSIQSNEGTNSGTTETTGSGTVDQTTTGSSNSTSKGENRGSATNQNTKSGTEGSHNDVTKGTNTNESTSTQSGESKGSATTIEFVNMD